MENGSSITVPGYDLESKCGCGGSSEVWVAHDIHGVRRAVRIVRKETPFPSGEQDNEHLASYRSFSEESVHLLHFIYAGETRQCFYYVSELADDLPIHREECTVSYTADTLSRRLTTHKHSLREILDCILDILCGLEYLHKHHVAHHDLKPENILFLHNELKLADPGLLLCADRKSRSGSPGFCPEWEADGTEADIYALGKIIYCLITSSRDPSSFPELNAGSLDKSLFPLNEIALRCCEADHRCRYRSCAEIRCDVMALLQDSSPARKLFSENLIALLIILCTLQSIFLSVSLCCCFPLPGRNFSPVEELLLRFCSQFPDGRKGSVWRRTLSVDSLFRAFPADPLSRKGAVSISGGRLRNDA